MKRCFLLFSIFFLLPCANYFASEISSPTKEALLTTPPGLAELDREIASQSQAGPSYQALFIKTMVLVLLLLGVTTLGLFLLKRTQARFLKPKEQSHITVLEKQALSPKTQALLLKVQDKEVLVLESAHQVTVCPLQKSSETPI